MDVIEQSSICCTEDKSPDIDHGWAYVVAIAAISLFLLGPGFTFSTGFLYVIFLDEFENSATTTAWILTVNSLFTFGMGTLSGVLNNWLSVRQIIIIGCALSTTGLIITSYAQNLTTVFIGFSVMSGIGWGMSCMWTFEMIARYFNRKRPFMLSCISNGTGFGQILIPPMFLIFMYSYGWRGALFIFAGVNLNMLVIAAVFMNPREYELTDYLLSKKVESENPKSTVQKTFKERICESVTIFKDPGLMLHGFGMIFSSLAVGAFQTHISNYGRDLGFTEAQYSTLPSVSGTTNLIGRFIVSIVIQTGKIKGIPFTMIGLTVLGLSCILCAIVRMYIGLSLLTALVGLSLGVWSLVPQVVIEVIGPDHVASGTSHVLMLSAFGWAVGGPLAGLLLEIDTSYRSSFICIGCIELLGAVSYIPAFRRQRRKRVLHDLPVYMETLNA